MRFCQVSEILKWIETFHEEMAKVYERVKENSSDERVVLLLNYLTDHERKLSESINKYETDAADKLLNTWSRECPTLELPESTEEMHHRLSGKDVDDILIQAIDCHDVLINAYKEFQQASEVESVKALFEDLADMESNEKLRMVRDSLYLSDY